ncbi:MAG: LysR family transcriptional regulator [Janthinobacterium lividum]
MPRWNGMELGQLRCFVAAAEELHFGRAAQRLDMLPSTLGRQIQALERDLGAQLLARTTRSVTLTENGALLLGKARVLLAQADAAVMLLRAGGRGSSTTLRIGAIDSAAAGLLPLLLHDLRERRPEIAVQLVEDKTIRLLPKLLSGRLDLAFVRPPAKPDPRLEVRHLLHETAVVAVPSSHHLAARAQVTVEDLAGLPMIVPERRSRPHSHDLTITLFAQAGLQARVAQIAEEKQTIVALVAADIGIAIVPRWTARMVVPGVTFKALDAPGHGRLPLAACWAQGTRDLARDEMLALLQAQLVIYAAQA